MRRSFERKPILVGFVLAALLTLEASLALAEDLPPPPPPPPGAKEIPPPAPNETSVLDAPPPPPPGVKIEAPSAPPRAPTPTTTTTPPGPGGLSAPPPPPPGVTEPPPEPKPRPRASRQTPPMPPTGGAQANTLPDYDARNRPSREKKDGGWYGWQSLIGVIPSYAMYGIGSTAGGSSVSSLGVLGGVFVTPIVHWTHGNIGRGFLSMAGNAGAMLLGYNAGDEAGLIVGGLLFAALDIAAFHWEDSPRRPPLRTTKLGIESFTVVPMVDGDRKGLSIVGQF